MGVLSAIQNIASGNATLRFDINKAHRQWRYDSTDPEEAEAIQSFAEYVTGHGIPRSVVEVFTKGDRIYFTHATVIGGVTNDRFLHYLVYPDWAQTHDYNKYSDSRSGTDWSISFEKAKKLDPEYHSRCPFYYGGTCDYCNGPNENQVG